MQEWELELLAVFLAYLSYSFYKNTNVSTEKVMFRTLYVRNELRSPENVKIKRKEK